MSKKFGLYPFGAPSGKLPFPASGSPRQDSAGGGSPRGQAISARMHKKIRGACYAVQIAEIQKTKPYPKNSDKALSGAPSGNLPFPASGSPRQDSAGGGSPRGQAISARMHKKIRGACYAVQIAEIQKTKPYPKNSDKALFGAPSGTRTLGPLIKSQLLYQLS